jgi:acetyl esterase
VARIADCRLTGVGVSAYDIVPDSHAEENAMTDTRPFDPALFAEAAIDAETAKMNAEMIRLLADQPDWWITGAETFRAMRRRGEGPRIADNTGQAVVGVEYRLAPEHPYPAGPDDCEAVAAWLVQNGKKEFGADALTIGGESAGGHLTAVTILRMRDRHGYTGFRGANIVYGAFDLSMTPSQRQFGNTTRLVLRTIDMQQFYNAFLPTITDRRVPDISPLYADLKGLCPALFSVGTKDALLDDTLFMHARWVAAGNEAELAVYPGGAHGFTLFPNDLSKAATAKMDGFLNRVLD